MRLKRDYNNGRSNMEFDLDNIPFWTFIAGQIIFFFLLIFLALTTFSILIVLLFIIIEVIALLAAYRNNKRWFFIGWEFEAFLFLLLAVVLNFDHTFQVADPEPVTVAVMGSTIVAVEIVVLFYMILGEKVIRWILFTLASSTSIIVFLIIFFVISEGAPAFIENDPVDLIGGTYFNPNYDIDTEEVVFFETAIEPYSFDLEFLNHEYLIPSSINSSIVLVVHNTGGSPDHYSVELDPSEGLMINETEHEFQLENDKSKEIQFDAFSEDVGDYDLEVVVRSLNSTGTLSEHMDIRVSDHGIRIEPNSMRITEVGMDVAMRYPVELENLGGDHTSINVSFESPSALRPSFLGDDFEWNYSTNSAIVEFEGHEVKEVQFIPRIINLIEGEYIINATFTSVTDTEESSSAVFHYEYIRTDYLTALETSKSVNSGGSVKYSFFVQGASGLTLDLNVENIVGGWEIEVENGDEVILSNYGMTNFTIGQAGTEYFNLTVHGDGEFEGDISRIRLSIIRAGEVATYGILPFIVGTLSTTALAICIAAPLGIGTAVFLSEFCPNRIRRFLRPLFELLAGILSVIYGLWGFLTFGPLLAGTLFPILGETGSDGRCILTASIVLGIMILPIVITLSEDSIRAISKEMKEGSYAVGSTKWQTIKGVTLKAASSGIIASIILGIGRAIGETMAVLMIMGGSNSMPDSIFDRAGTMTSAIALYFGDVASLEQSKHVIFAIGMILFFMVFLLSVIAYSVHKRMDPSSSPSKRASKWRKSISNYLSPITVNLPRLTWKKESIERISEKRSDKLLDRSKFRSSRSVLLSERVVKCMMIAGSLLVLAILIYILVDILIRGGSTINLQLFLERESLAGKEGGFLNAIVGSLGMVAIALMVAIPLAIGAAIYVQEYAKSNNPMTRLVTFASDVLASTPSIVYGVFGFVFLVIYLRLGPSMLAGGITLGFMIIPLLLRSAIEALKSVPRDHRSASLALGASKWQTVQKIVIFTSFPFLISGTVISMGRAIGETAAVLFTAAYSSFIVDSIMQPTASMPVMIYQYYEVSSKFPGLAEKVYSAALTLIIFVLLLNIVARIAGHQASKGMRGK
jgi:phosphate transport system permease protein